VRIDSITVYKLEIPITERYQLSFGSIESFQTFLVLIESGQRTGIGETTPLHGYNWEDHQSVHQFLMDSVPQLIGLHVSEARNTVTKNRGNNYFAATSLCSAMELLENDLFEDVPVTDVPLVGIVSGSDIESILKSIKKQQSQGYTCVKVKVGGENGVERDVSKIKSIYNFFPNLPLRVDANKGYTYDEALYFVKQIQECNIEEFEQPFPVGSWDEMERLSRHRGKIKLMLDESIDTKEELAEAISRRCCDFVKFKLMKHSSVYDMLDLIKMAREAGLEVIIGNGVAADIGCHHEALIQAKTGGVIAGEMNGFLKQKESILKQPLSFERGSVRVGGGVKTELNQKVVERYLVKKEVFI